MTLPQSVICHPIRLSIQQCNILVLLLDSGMYAFQVMRLMEGRTLRSLMKMGLVEPKAVFLDATGFVLTEPGRGAAVWAKYVLENLSKKEREHAKQTFCDPNRVQG